MNLLNSEATRVEKSKITDYLLAADHPEGASKAEFFFHFGFTRTNWETLASALAAHALAHPVSSITHSKYGTKYRIDSPLISPDGRAPLIRTVWIIDSGSDAPRRVTAHPLE